uniref:Transmembrane protein 88 n=1 Tax=Terrapene triunguis TaxID=2587831 RepID=A0A674J6A1_9SAUR
LPPAPTSPHWAPEPGREPRRPPLAADVRARLPALKRARADTDPGLVCMPVAHALTLSPSPWQFLHARVAPCEAHLHDAGATALLVLGFTLLLPLLVLGLAAFVRLARRLQLGYCLLPYSLAVYRHLPAGRYHQAAWCCPRARAHAPGDKVWV